jgi:hypothetical protein
MIVLWSNAWRSILIAKNVGGCPGNAPAIFPGLAGSFSSGDGIRNRDSCLVRDEVVRLARVGEAKMQLAIAAKEIAHAASSGKLSAMFSKMIVPRPVWQWSTITMCRRMTVLLDKKGITHDSRNHRLTECAFQACRGLQKATDG